MTMQNLSPDQLLSTTRSVRKRLDLERPVERALIQECLSLAQQAPHQGNAQAWHFVIVTDPDQRAALAAVYRRGWEIYRTMFERANARANHSEARKATQARVYDSAQYLADNLHRVPVHVIPCIGPRPDGSSAVSQSAQWGSIAPATWSFMLAARARGLGTVWTSVHLFFEADAAAILGIPYDKIQQACLIPLAHVKGAEFKPGPREPLEKIAHWDRW